MTEPARKLVEKPPYQPGTVRSAARTPWNGVKVVSLFSGCGGTCLGFRLAGYRTAWANEFVPAAAATYRANFPAVKLDESDIRTVSPERILEAAELRPGDRFVVEGSPPCASFSTAGRRQKLWGQVRPYSDVEQRVDDLFGQYARIVSGLRPHAFVAENVAGLTKGVAVGFYLEFLKAMESAGYRVRAKILDASWLGVPQERVRLFVVGVRNDLGREPAFPTPLPYRYALRDAIPYTFAVKLGRGRLRSSDRPAPTVQTHGRRKTQSELSMVETGASLKGFAVGREWEKLHAGEQSERYFNLVRPSMERPCPTVTQTAGNPGAAGVAHPTECRKFSISELKAICGFPDDFVLTGTYAQQWERLGRAVPPPMAYHVARALFDGVFR